MLNKNSIRFALGANLINFELIELDWLIKLTKLVEIKFCLT